MREEKREKDKGREKEGQKTTKSKMEKVISSPQLRTIRAVFFIQKSLSHVKRVFFGCEAIFKIPANTLRA